MSKLLLVEDDAGFAQSLMASLEAARYVIDHALCAEDAWQFLQSYAYELIVLDWELPGASGPELCRQMKKAYPYLPVLMLTGRIGTGNTVFGLDAGADDYVQKPCNTDELFARIRALLRRPADADEDMLVCGQLKLIEKSHSAELCGCALELSPREFELLRFFLNHPDKHFNADALFSRIWTNRPEISAE